MAKDNKHPGGRPKMNIDIDLVSKLASIQCTPEEIAYSIDISTIALKKNKLFKKVYKKAFEEGKKSLRRLQFDKAKGKPAILATDKDGKVLKDDKGRPFILDKGYAPDTVMQIWLGKQYLGQADKQELTGKDRSPIEFVVKYGKRPSVVEQAEEVVRSAKREGDYRG